VQKKADDSWPQIAVVGAGAVGGYFGGLLVLAGAPVIMIGRPQFVEAVKSGGLVVETTEGERRLSVTASTAMRDAAKADVILLCVKTSDTANVAKALAEVIKAGARVVSLQNGVDNVERIRETSGLEALAAVVYVAVSVVRPGHIKHLARGDLVVGPEARDIAELFARAQVRCGVSNNIEAELWTKLATNCALNALSALARAPYGRIVESSEGRDFMNAIVDEVFSVAQAAGIKSPNFTQGGLRKAAFNLADQMPTTMSSTAQDLWRGKKTEIDSLNGYVSRRGAELGLATPANDVLRNLIKLSEQGGAADSD
jgi:2-dehydropantoate 2-reductase